MEHLNKQKTLWLKGYKKLDADSPERLKVEVAVACVSDEKLRNVLELRYIKGMKWREVAEAIHYGEMQVMSYHRQAIEAVQMPIGGMDFD